MKGNTNWKDRKHTEETKRKMSRTRKGICYSDETKKKMSESHKGKIISLETRKKMSIIMKGNTNGKGYKHTAIQIQKMREAKKNISKETRKKISRALRGEKCHRAKLTEVQVFEIKKLLNTNLKGTEIAKHFDVTRYTISDIKRGKTWKHITLS